MSSPPRYENLSRQDEDSSLLKKNRFEDEEVDEEATVGTSYPPRHQAGSGDVNVTMTFVPRYPVRGKTEHALSVIGESREVSDRLQAYWPCEWDLTILAGDSDDLSKGLSGPGQISRRQDRVSRPGRPFTQRGSLGQGHRRGMVGDEEFTTCSSPSQGH